MRIDRSLTAAVAASDRFDALDEASGGSGRPMIGQFRLIRVTLAAPDLCAYQNADGVARS